MLVIGRFSRTVKGTVHTSCLCKWTEPSRARAVVSHFAEVAVVVVVVFFSENL